MRTDNKKGIKWWLFRHFGPPEVVNLINHIDSLTQDGEHDIAIYQAGRFDFHVKSSEPGAPEEPFIFATQEERYCFQVGMNWGVQICGGSAHNMSEEDFATLSEMQKKSTHGGGNA